MSLETYDRLWTETWGDQQSFGPVHRRQREELLKVITKLDVLTVLDVGCGFGDNLAALAHARRISCSQAWTFHGRRSR